MAFRPLSLFLPLCVLVALTLSACDHQPGVDELRNELTGLLEREFKPGLYEILSVRRMGSTSTRDKATGDQRMTVYFNAELRFRQDFDLTSWDGLNAASLTFLLGATEKGVDGVRPGGNRENDILRVHGSRLYALRQGAWQPLLITARRSATGKPNGEAPQIIARINQLAERASLRYGGTEQAVIDKELTASLTRIERTLDQLSKTLSVASGPSGGAYHRYIQTLEDNARQTGFRVRNHATQGSVENCKLVQSGGVDIAIAQSNIAALATAGEGPFKQVGRQPGLRALTALFPEYLQVIVANGTELDGLRALKGKRIDIGLPDSGTRVDALRLLNALGLRLPDFAEVRESGLEAAAKAMRAGELDAFFTTLQAPTQSLQNLLASGDAHLWALPTDAREQMLQRHGVYRQATVAAHTYPGQHEPVSTLSVSATLIVRDDLPDERATQILDSLFKSAPVLARKNLRLTLLSRQTAREGIAIALHPAAEAYFAQSSPPH